MSDAKPLQQWATWRETLAQPAIWRDWAARPELAETRDWCQRHMAQDVWFCGAGSSSFIGDIVVAGLEARRGPVTFRSVATTDIVARPHAYLKGRNPLLVNFGRSGNSSETIGTLDALDALIPLAPRLNMTCNPDSVLATRPSKGPQHVCLLPEKAHDSGFAMTSSFSTMLLTALAAFDPDGDPETIAHLGDCLREHMPLLQERALAMPVAGRIVFVGSGALTYAARESALKLLELTSGQVPALWESTLGFRHGPKSFIQPGTQIVVFKSSEPHAASYDDDLVAELKEQFPGENVLTIGRDADIGLPGGFGDAWAAPLFVVFAQLLGVAWSNALSLNVDDPFEGLGTLTRVVKRVKLYEVTV